MENNPYTASKSEWHKLSDGLPPLGVPLMVKTVDSTQDNAVYLKYPVYYAKTPYDFKYQWFFFPACEGMTQLLTNYSNVIEWREISDASAM